MLLQGEIKQGSLPVELWVQGQKRTWENNDSTGQLTNKQINWISLNRLMVNEGLALPLTRLVSFYILFGLNHQTFKPVHCSGYLENVNVKTKIKWS